MKQKKRKRKMSELYIAENIVIDDIEFVISKIEERTGLTGVK